MNTTTCPTCGGPLIQKNKIHLFQEGVVFIIIGAGLLLLSLRFWPLTFFLIVISIYLFAWSFAGKGLWCRQCKAVPFKK